ncbi:hypothetical protein THRCLA_20446 [Thraustotheca clavata]|uniref:Dynactin subunit 3 n=1 Tax=Thraustotheca clavata TaxID=74557 RepID=A0A1W0A735_9STRA|nr:hypothetical protein THRCLA_20446 [Thraustotheca clavata]
MTDAVTEAEILALERRLALLQGIVGKRNEASVAPSVHVRLQELTEKLNQVETHLDPPNFGALRNAYEQNKKLLEPGFLQELKLQSHASSSAMEETKKAIVLTSMDAVNRMASDAQSVQELERYVDIPAIAPQVHEALTRAETANLLLAQQVMARHGQVESLLLQYSRIMENMSKKFQLYDQLLTQLEKR